MDIRKNSGFTLIEVMVSMSIFAIGSLGVLAMVGSTIDLNRSARQNDEATLLGMMKLEHLQTLPTTDAELGSTCTPTSPCWEDYVSGALVKAASGPKGIRADTARGDSNGTSILYQLYWGVESPPSTFMQSGRHIVVTVAWPRDPKIQTVAPGTAPGIDCSVGTNSSLCHLLVFHSVRDF